MVIGQSLWLLGIFFCALQEPAISRLAVNIKTVQYALELMMSYGLNGLGAEPQQDSVKLDTVFEVGSIHWQTALYSSKQCICALPVTFDPQDKELIGCIG